MEAHQGAFDRPKSRGLSDGSRQETPNRPPNHKWSTNQRLTLSILRESYSNGWDDLTAVFNRYHKSDIRRRRLRSAVVRTQFCDMRRKDFDVAASFKQSQPTLPNYERSVHLTRLQLEKKANEIGIVLIVKAPTKRKRVDVNDDSRTDFLSDIESQQTLDPQATIDLTFPKTPTKDPAQKQSNGLLTPPDSKRRKIRTFTVDKKLAQIGFRASTSQSQGSFTSALGIRAGAFLNSPTIPLAQDLAEARYRAEAL